MTTPTVDYLLADMHRAMHHGARTLEVSIKDLSELLARVEAAEKRTAVAFSGKPLGFCKAHKMRAMLSGSRKFITISLHKNEHFDTPVCFTELPPKEVQS